MAFQTVFNSLSRRLSKDIDDKTLVEARDRSVSRGRDNYTSSGRGGLGNIRPASQSRDRPTDGPDDFSSTRGRELPPASTTNKIISTGRGGLGNLRSPSRDAAAPINDQEELRILREHSQEKRDAPISTGRGGAGNINRSRSRETAHATNVGQGGFFSKHSTVNESIDESSV